jgi:heme exporter protein A
MGVRAGDRTARTESALEAFGLLDLDMTPAQYLSAGQKKRLSLSRLLLVDRPLWLLDEPSVGLDTASVALLAEAMRSHLAGGGTILAATHIDLGLPSETLQIDRLAEVAA